MKQGSSAAIRGMIEITKKQINKAESITKLTDSGEYIAKGRSPIRFPVFAVVV